MTISQLIKKLSTMKPHAVVRVSVWRPVKGSYVKVKGVGTGSSGLSIEQLHRTDLKPDEYDVLLQVVLDE